MISTDEPNAPAPEKPDDAPDADAADAKPATAASSALIVAREVRIDRGGAPEIEKLTFTSAATSEERAIVLGAPRVFFEACAGLTRVHGGEIRIAGDDARQAAISGKTAAAPAVMPLPEKWTLLEFTTWSARLGGAAKSRAELGAHQALSRLDFGDHAKTALAKAPAHVRALAPLVAALATQAPFVLMEDPTTTLAGDVARGLARKIVAALSGKQWILFAGQIALDSPFALHADEAIVIGGTKVSQGAVAEVAAREGTYAVRIHGEARTFAKLVVSQGGTSKGDGEDLLVDLGEKLRTKDLFELAEQAHSVIVELRPLSRAFV